MTEDDAKTKWCPMFQVSAGMTGNDDVNNRMGLCIASECMAWRWRRKPKPEMVEQSGHREVTIPADPGSGYCGLAGDGWSD